MEEFVSKQELAAEAAKRAQAERAANAAENDLRDLYDVNRELKKEIESRELALMELRLLLSRAQKKIEELRDLNFRMEDKLTEAREEMRLLSAVMYLFTSGEGVPLTADNVKAISRAIKMGAEAVIDEQAGEMRFEISGRDGE